MRILTSYLQSYVDTQRIDSIAFGTRALGGMASWKLLIGIGLIFPAMLILGISTMPESPRYAPPPPHSSFPQPLLTSYFPYA